MCFYNVFLFYKDFLLIFLLFSLVEIVSMQNSECSEFLPFKLSTLKHSFVKFYSKTLFQKYILKMQFLYTLLLSKKNLRQSLCNDQIQLNVPFDVQDLFQFQKSGNNSYLLSASINVIVSCETHRNNHHHWCSLTTTTTIVRR